MEFIIDNYEFDKCFINEEKLKTLSFENGFAIARVNVIRRDESTYECLAIIKRINNKQSTRYEIVDNCPSIFLNENVKNITMVGTHLIVEVEKANFEKTIFSKEFVQIDFQCLYNETVFKERSKIPGVPIAFSPKALVISAKENACCLFSLESSDIACIEYSMIDVIDDDFFLVTDIIAVDEDSTLKDQAIFKMNYLGERVSNVYLRSIQDFTDDDDKLPYLFIRERIEQELKQSYHLAEKNKQLLRRG